MGKIKRILISQPKPQSEKSPYFDLASKFNLDVEFEPFIAIEGVTAQEFRKERIDILKHSAVIFTSKTAIDHFFRMSEDMRVCIPDSMKYFCISESTAFYLQKYIVYRKRKIFFGNGTFADLMNVLVKHEKELFFVPLSDVHQKGIPDQLEKAKLKFTASAIYRTVSSDLSHIDYTKYDMIIFFSPLGIKSLQDNFPNFVQGDLYIGALGLKTCECIEDAGLRLDINAPTPKTPSITAALEAFIANNHKKK